MFTCSEYVKGGSTSCTIQTDPRRAQIPIDHDSHMPSNYIANERSFISAEISWNKRLLTLTRSATKSYCKDPFCINCTVTRSRLSPGATILKLGPTFRVVNTSKSDIDFRSSLEYLNDIALRFPIFGLVLETEIFKRS